MISISIRRRRMTAGVFMVRALLRPIITESWEGALSTLRNYNRCYSWHHCLLLAFYPCGQEKCTLTRMEAVDAAHIWGSDLPSFTPLFSLLSLNVNLDCAEGNWTDLVCMARAGCSWDVRGGELCLAQEGLQILSVMLPDSGRWFEQRQTCSFRRKSL